jgi:two-component system response regulator WspF
MKVCIAHASDNVTQELVAILRHSSQDQLGWIARTGSKAIELCRKERPDLLLLDLDLARNGTVSTVRTIMATTPCAVLIISDALQLGSGKVFEAIGAGAVDALATSIGRSLHTSSSQRMALLAKIDSLRNLVQTGVKNDAESALEANKLVVIGASAGGPPAVRLILEQLQIDNRSAVVLIQHLDAQFAAGMVTWLESRASLKVRLVEQYEILRPATVHVPARQSHLRLKPPSSLVYSDEPRHAPYTPSIDVFMEDVAAHWQCAAVGVLLTGMGRDGARGLRAMRAAGFHTIAQDEKTSAVYGMPKAAAALGAATEILPLHQIPDAIRSALLSR